ncbi:hypothetical protein BASA60_002424, partial [Batrachochytrium salamandrivorans]
MRLEPGSSQKSPRRGVGTKIVTELISSSTPHAPEPR